MSTQPSAISGQSELWPLLVDEMIDQASSMEVDVAKRIIEAYFAGNHKLERKQMSNLVAIAGETGSVPIVEDFVRYQMGRDTNRRTWNAGHPKSLGNSILDHLKELKNSATALLERARKRAPELAPSPADEKEKNRVWSLLTCRFVAYLEHAFVYYKNEKGLAGGEQ
jgi:hypothetical protein